MPANIKTTLLQRLRRTDMPLARRVRQLHADWFDRMGNGGQLPAPVDEKRLSPVLLAQQVHLRSTHCMPFIQELPSKLQSQWTAHQRHAQALLRNSPSSDDEALNATEMTLNQFLSATQDADAPQTSVQSLSALIFRLGQTAAPQEVIQSFLSRATTVLMDAEQTLGHMEQSIQPLLSPTIFQGRSGCIIQIDPIRAHQCRPSLFHHMLGLPMEQPLVVIGNTFHEGRAPFILQHGASTTLPTDVAEWVGPAGQPDFLQLHGHPINPDTDSILNQPQHKGIRSPLQSLADRLDVSTNTPSGRLQLTIADLDDFAKMQAMAGVGHFRFRDRQLPNSLLLKKDESVYVFMQDRWQPASLNALPDSTECKIRPSLDGRCELTLPAATVRQLQQVGQIQLSLIQQNASQLKVAQHLSPSLTGTGPSYWPDPAQKNRQLLTSHYAAKLAEPGYLDKIYTRDELRESERLVGAPPGALQDGVLRMLKSTMARTLVSIDTWTHQHQQGAPYYVSLTLMSPRQDGTYTRRIGCFIHDADTPLPTSSQLQQLGVDADTFMRIAVSSKDAEAQLLRPLRNMTSAPFALTGHNLDADLARIQVAMPLLTQTLSDLPSVSRQPVVLTQQLAGRRDRVFTVALARDNERPVHFFDAAGTEHSLMNIHTLPAGQWSSHDRSATLLRQGDQVVLIDHKTGLQGVIGAPLEVAQRIQRDLRPAQGALHSSLAKNLCLHQQGRQWLKETTPDTPLQMCESIPLDNIPMRRADFRVEQCAALDQIWTSTQPFYRFDWSIDDNLRHLTAVLETHGLQLNTVIAGGTGGQRGRQYLRALHQAQPELLSPLLQGKSFAWHPDAIMNDAARLDPADTTLTVSTWLHANMLRLLRSNPERAMHAQMEHHVDAFLLQFEPTTQELSTAALERWAVSTGISAEQWKALYQKAYAARQGLGMYESLVMSNDQGHPLGAHPVRELAAFSAALSQSALPQQGQSMLMMHSAGRWLDEKLKELSLQNTSAEHLLVTPQLKEHRLQLHVVGGEPTGECETAVEAMLPLLHLSNAMHRTTAKAGLTDPSLQEHARRVLSVQLQSTENMQRMEAAQRAFKDAGISDVQVRPANTIFRSWCKQSMLYAMSLSDVMPDFNHEFSAGELSRAMEHLGRLLPELQLRYQSSSPNAEQRLTQVFQQARLQFVAISTLHEWRQSLPGFPLCINDQTTQKRQYAQQCEDWQIPVVQVSLTDAVRAIAQNTELPLPCRYALRGYEEEGNLPYEPLARQIVQQTIKNLRTPPPLSWGDHGPINGLLRDFHVSATHPFAKILDTPRYRELLNPTQTSPLFVREQSLKRGPA